MKVHSVILIICVCTGSVHAQKPLHYYKAKEFIKCPASNLNNPISIPPPAEYLSWKKNPIANKTQTTNIEVTYANNVPSEAKDAFQIAVDIWRRLIYSPVTIRIEVSWQGLPGFVALAGPGGSLMNFKGAQKLDVTYPIALAEKIIGENMNEDEADIVCAFNNFNNWHFDQNTFPPLGKFDFITVALHEIAHGLGFHGSFQVNENLGLSHQLTIYDVAIENGNGENFIETFPSPSVLLKDQIISNDVYADYLTFKTRLFAPNPFKPSSSIHHLDDAIYDNTPNGLMTHFIGFRESIRNPGIALDILNRLGWKTIRIIHDPLHDSENVNGSFIVKADIDAPDGYNSESVKLNYTRDGINFITIPMTEGSSNTFTAAIPGNGSVGTYQYFISVTNNENIEYVNPGKVVRKLNTQLQETFAFDVGPDTEAPEIDHSPKSFTFANESLIIDARISDNTGNISAAFVEYFLNDVPQINKVLSPTTPEDYSTMLTFPILKHGDEIKYRIIAMDQASSPNPSYSPSSTQYHVLKVIELGETRDVYSNDFEDTEHNKDFFGNGYTIVQVASFDGRAIHSEHPYIHGEGFPNNERNLIYQLRYPIRVKATEAFLKFDEIVLVEPGLPGAIFGSSDFYDYVIVEGSKDGGVNWDFLLPGYNSSSVNTWLSYYNKSFDLRGNSLAVGESSLYRNRTIDLLKRFKANDEILIRFRTYIDLNTGGWGWAIDNVKIQVDDIAPRILNNHKDYLVQGANVLPVHTIVTDAGLVKTLKFETKFNNGTVKESIIDISSPQEEVEATLNIEQEDHSAFPLGDIIEYRILSSDTIGNVSTFPPSGFIKVPIITFNNTITQYHNSFNTATTDLIGNFFNISQPEGFSSGAVHTDHVYPIGFGLDHTSNLSYMLIKPITISASNSIMRFDEIVIVEGHSSGVVFGDPAFNDYVIVEGSKDKGETWIEFLDGYDAVGTSIWVSAFNNKTNGTSSMFRRHTINMIENGEFEPGDEVIVRFRLFSNTTLSGWGWAIDNLYIQDPITKIENQLESTLAAYPNPIQDKIFIHAETQLSHDFSIELLTLQGQKIYEATAQVVNGEIDHIIPSEQLLPGMYFLKISDTGKLIIKKLIKQK